MRLLFTLLVLFLIVNCGHCTERGPLKEKRLVGSSKVLCKRGTAKHYKEYQSRSSRERKNEYSSSKSRSFSIKAEQKENTRKKQQKLPDVKPWRAIDHGGKSASQGPTKLDSTDSMSLALEKLTLKERTVTPSEDKGEPSCYEEEPILPKRKKSSSTSKEKSDFEKASEELQNILKSNKVETEEASPSTVTVQQPPLVAHVKLMIQGTYDHMGLFDPELRLFKVSGENISIFASYRGQGFPFYIPFSAEGVPITVDSTGLLICQGYFERPYDVLVLLMELPSTFHRNPGEAAARLRELNCYYYGTRYVRPLPLRPSNPKMTIN